MSMTVAEALQIEPLNHCQLVAGSGGYHRIIRKVSVMDSPDITSWLKSGDLLLTTGYVFQDDDADQKQLIKDLHDLNGAGLGIKLKRFLSEIPAAMIAEADRLNVPLFVIAYDLAFSDLIFTLTEKIVKEQSHDAMKIEGGHFVAELVKGGLSDAKEIFKHGEADGLLPDHDYTVLCIDTFSGTGHAPLPLKPSEFVQILREASDFIDVRMWGAYISENIVLMQSTASVDGITSPALARQAASLITDRIVAKTGNTNFSVGIGKCKQDVSLVPESYREAKEAIYLGKRIQPNTWEIPYAFADFEPDALLQHLPNALLCHYVDVTLKTLKQHDQDVGSDLVHTLDVYLASGKHIGQTSQTLYIHRNTVKFRVSRIEALLGVDLSDEETVFRLRLGLRIAHLLQGSSDDHAQ